MSVFGLRSATAWRLPPRPPSPPSGPPRGTYFSRLKLATPSPPLPAWTSMMASSTNFINKKALSRDRACGGRRPGSGGNDAHRLAAIRPLLSEQHAPRDPGEQRMVAADADVRAGMHLSAGLAPDE